MVVITKKKEETLALGAKIAKEFKGGEILKLQGNLGAGKTAFVKGLAKGLGIKKPVRSPTFNLMKVYTVKNNLKIKKMVHLDCYRIKNPLEIVEIGLLDYLQQPHTLTVIEWPEKIKTTLKRYQTKNVFFTNLGENRRKISFNLKQTH